MRRICRRHELPIVDPDRHPKPEVGLAVAAAFLGIDPRTLTSRVEAGIVRARRDGKVWRFLVTDLVAHRERTYV